MKLKTALMLIVTALLFCAQANAQSVLAQTASSMQPGEWRVLNQDGDGSGYGYTFTESGVGTALGYAGKVTFDPVRCRIFHLGAGHPLTSPIKFMNYDCATNRWVLLPTPQWAIDMQSNGHTYNLQAITPGQYFRMYANSYEIRVADIDKADVADINNSTWSDYPDPSTVQASNRGVLEYFPDRNNLFLIDGGLGKVWEKPLASPDWIDRGTFFPELYGDGIAGVYNPIHHVIVFGGGGDGTRIWRKMDASGQISRIDDAPIDTYAISHTLVSVDPISGKYILIRPSDFTSAPAGWWFYELDITKAVGTQWTRRTDLEAGIPQFYSGYSVFASTIVPIHAYGVNLVMSVDKTYLYKHATGGTPPPPPPPPINAAPICNPIPNQTVTTPASVTLSVSCTDDGLPTGSKLTGVWTGAGVTLGSPQATTTTATAPVGSYQISYVASDGALPSLPRTMTLTVTPSVPPPPPPPDTPFSTKLQQPGVIAGYGFDATSNVRNFPAASPYAMRYFWSIYSSPSCNNAGLGTNYTFDPTTRGPDDGNALATEDGGTCRFPIIDNGALRIEVPGRSGSSAGGYFDTPFRGVDLPHVKISPDNGGEVWYQWKVKTQNMNLANFNGAIDASKVAILGPAPPWMLGSDGQMSTVISDDLSKNNIVSGYSYGFPTGGGASKQWDRWVNGNLYMQNASECQYSGVGSYPSPPCLRFRDDGTFQELTIRHKLRAVASDFTISGNILSSPGRFAPWWSGSPNTEEVWIYIEGDGYYVTDDFIDNDSVRLTAAPKVQGAGKTAWISTYNNTQIQIYLDGQLAINLEDGAFKWDGANGVPAGFGAFRLIPHMTNKKSEIDHPTAFIWYDEVIVSTQAIAMGSSAPPPPPPVNAAPVCNTIPNQTVTAPASATLAVSCNDDGLPAGSKLTGQWSGNSVTFGSPQATTTTATATAGNYVISYTASDGVLSSIPRAMTLTVNAAVPPPPPPPGDTVAPVVAFKTPNGTTFSSNAKLIEFTASDNVGVVLCTPTVNGIAIQHTPIFTTGAKLPATVKFYLQQATIPKAEYILGVSCRDAAGNMGTAQPISVIRK